jgi:hypothetical protein
LVVAAITAPAAAFHDSTLPVLSSDVLPNHGAASYRFTVPQGAQVEVELETMYEGANLIGDGFWLYNATGQPLISFMSTWSIGGDPEVHIELPDPIGVVHDIRPQPQSFGSGSLVGMALDAGTYVALIGTVSNGTLIDGKASLFASAGSALINKVVSTGGFAYDEAAFEGTTVLVGAPAGLPIFVPGPVVVDPSLRPLVMANASTSASIARSLYGWFGGFNLVQQTTVDGPDGTLSGDQHFFDGATAGDYTFTVDLSASVPGGRIWAWGLDPALA